MIPQTFDEWRNCITQDCKVNLNKDFALQHLVVYLDADHPETQKFTDLYGEQHLLTIILWLK